MEQAEKGAKGCEGCSRSADETAVGDKCGVGGNGITEVDIGDRVCGRSDTAFGEVVDGVFDFVFGFDCEIGGDVDESDRACIDRKSVV